MKRIRWDSLLGLWFTAMAVTALLNLATGFKYKWLGSAAAFLIGIFWPYRILKGKDNDGSQG